MHRIGSVRLLFEVDHTASQGDTYGTCIVIPEQRYHDAQRRYREPEKYKFGSMGKFMARDLVAYWEPKTVDAALAGDGSNNHAANNQFRRMKVSKGDTVWFVTVRNGRLQLITRLVVGHVTSQRGAARLLGVRSSDLYHAKDHIVAEEGTVSAVVEQDIHVLAPQLRFESASGNDRLKLLPGGDANPQQFQTMRVLTPATASLLASVISAGDKRSAPESPKRVAGSAGGGFGQYKQNNDVENAAIMAVCEWYEKWGWEVRSVEDQGCGFDLLCRRNGKEVHVEVKGVSGTAQQFIATAGEVRRMNQDRQFVLAFVPDALSGNPAIQFWSGECLCQNFRFEPIQFRVTRKARRSSTAGSRQNTSE